MIFPFLDFTRTRRVLVFVFALGKNRGKELFFAAALRQSAQTPCVII